MRTGFFLPLLFLYSCGETASAPATKKDPVVDSVPAKKDSLVQTPVDSWPKGIPVDMMALKKRYADHYLSSVVSPVKKGLQCGTDTTGFLGDYYFLGKSKNKESNMPTAAGTLTVFKPGTAAKWNWNATDEIFVSICVYSDEIKLWDSLYVGMSLAQLDSIFSGTIDKSGTVAVFTLPQSNAVSEKYDCFFYHNGKRVTKIIVQRKCVDYPDMPLNDMHPIPQ